MKIRYASQEAAPPLASSKGNRKGRIHLYDYKGEKGKDPYALAAESLNKLPRFHFPLLKNRYVILSVKDAAQETATYYKINRNSLCKRLGIKASELEKNIKSDRSIDATYLEKMINNCLDGAYREAINHWETLEHKEGFELPQHLDKDKFLKKLASKLDLEALQRNKSAWGASDYEELLRERFNYLRILLTGLLKENSAKTEEEIKKIEEEMAACKNQLFLLKYERIIGQSFKVLRSLNESFASIDNSFPLKKDLEANVQAISDHEIVTKMGKYFELRLLPILENDMDAFKLYGEKQSIKAYLGKLSVDKRIELGRRLTLEIGSIIQNGYLKPARDNDFINLEDTQKGIVKVLEIAEKEMRDLLGDYSAQEAFRNQFYQELKEEPVYQIFDIYILCKYRIWWRAPNKTTQERYFTKVLNKINSEYRGFAFSKLLFNGDVRPALEHFKLNKYEMIAREMAKGQDENEKRSIYQKFFGKPDEEALLESIYHALPPERKTHFSGLSFYNSEDLKERKVEKLNQFQVDL